MAKDVLPAKVGSSKPKIKSQNEKKPDYANLLGMHSVLVCPGHTKLNFFH
jgi:hypothetical protein